MRVILLVLLCSTALSAMDIEGVRFARRTLLHEQARKHLDCGVGDVAHLGACTVLRGDFDGDGNPDFAAVTRRDKRVVVAVFPAAQDAAGPTGIMTLIEDTAPEAATQPMPGRDCVRLETTTEKDEAATRHWRLLRWDGAKWGHALEFTRQIARSAAKGRFSRVILTTIETGKRLELVTLSRDTLDGTELAGSTTQSASSLTLTKEGAYEKGPTEGEDTPVPTRVQLARTLEREGLVEIALEQARAAVEKAERDKLAENDARLLDARTLAQRLQARVDAARAVVKASSR